MRLNALLRKVGGRMNPIAVKELRQISRGKFLTVILIGALLTQLTVTAAVTFYSRGSADPGPQLFLALLVVLTAVCDLPIPAYAGFRLTKERSASNRDLLFITTLKPASIVWGKLLSAAVIAALIYSVCMPLMAMTYMLRGVDLPSAFMLIAVFYLYTLQFTQVGIMIGCMPGNRIARWLVGIIGLLIIVLIGASLVTEFVQTLTSGSASPLEYELEDALVAVAILMFQIGAVFLISAAFLAPPSSNRALVPRVYMSAAWAVFLAAAVVRCEMSASHQPMFGWMFSWSCYFGWALTLSVSERDELGRRVRETIPRSRGRRALAFLFYSGSAGGFLWASIGLVLTIAAGSVALSAFPGTISSSEVKETLLGVVFTSMNFWTAAAGAVLIQRAILKNRVNSVHTWLIAAGIFIVSRQVWLWLTASSSSRIILSWEFFVGASPWSADDPPIAAAVLIAAVLVFICAPWIARQASAFKPLPLKTEET